MALVCRGEEERGEWERGICWYTMTMTPMTKKSGTLNHIMSHKRVFWRSSALKKTIEMARLTTSGLRRAKMAKVESLSHKHLVVLESTGTVLQPRADQEPSNEELRSGDRQDRGMRSNPRAIKQLFLSSSAHWARRMRAGEREKTVKRQMWCSAHLWFLHGQVSWCKNSYKNWYIYIYIYIYIYKSCNKIT